MHFNSALISCFLFAFAALAVEISNVYSGAVWKNQPEGTFKSVLGVFTVPEASTPEAAVSFVTMEIVFDDGSCPSGAKFRLGVELQTVDTGYSYRQALYQWYPDPVQKLDIDISTGDTIHLEFTQRSATSGEVFVNNTSNDHQSFNETISTEHPLCGQAAGWVIQDENNDNGDQTALANFGAVSFTQAKAGLGDDYFWGPFGATLVQFVGKSYFYDRFGHNMSIVAAYDDGSMVVSFLYHSGLPS